MVSPGLKGGYVFIAGTLEIFYYESVVTQCKHKLKQELEDKK